ncbi:transglycosylase [Brevundimonas goettingensis]|uniref:Transglycosylase n=1 Tax=Brevundimonas goettingensis TaxID=2774190 RepID=A0A975GWM3_9CAUL|nr:transglycosylase [Brevundimonas goettingensis]QTC92772.1 transglycosylase [Brevundimonas goettingensis]
MQYADIVIAALGVLAVAWIADLLSGKRGYFAALLVAGVGAVCGWFLPIRVFANTTMDSWQWVIWALGGAVFSLVAYYLFRNKR